MDYTENFIDRRKKPITAKDIVEAMALGKAISKMSELEKVQIHPNYKHIVESDEFKSEAVKNNVDNLPIEFAVTPETERVYFVYKNDGISYSDER